MLEGTLEGFSLPDILQLLALTKKSGRLELERGTARGRVCFRDGQVSYAESGRSRMALARRLVGAGLVGTDELEAAVAGRADDIHDLQIGERLVAAGSISAETLREFAGEQIQDAVFDLMRWSDGAFSFRTGDGSTTDGPIEISLDVEQLVMEGTRRLEEWESVHGHVPSREVVLAMAPGPDDADGEVRLTTEQWRLLTLVDGRRSVGELVEVFGQGEFHTSKVLAGMVAAGLLEVHEPTSGAGALPTLAAQHQLLRELEDTTTPATAQAAPPVQADDEESETIVEKPSPESAAPSPLIAKVSVPTGQARPAATTGPEEDESRLTTDPTIDEDLVRRLIDGVKEL